VALFLANYFNLQDRVAVFAHAFVQKTSYCYVYKMTFSCVVRVGWDANQEPLGLDRDTTMN